MTGVIFSLYSVSVCALAVECCSGHVLIPKSVSQLWSPHSSLPPPADAHLIPKPWQSQHALVVLFCLISASFGRRDEMNALQPVCLWCSLSAWRMAEFFFFFSRWELLNATDDVDEEKYNGCLVFVNQKNGIKDVKDMKSVCVCD